MSRREARHRVASVVLSENLRIESDHPCGGDRKGNE
jgi:hypothetical protein